MKKTLTIKDIARYFNISVATVSKALNNIPGISERKRKEIQDYALKNNYEKNLSAIALKKGKQKTIGVIIPEIADDFFALAVSGISKEAKNNNYNVTFMESHNDPLVEIENIKQLKSSNVAGIILCLCKLSGYSLNYLINVQNNGTPVVFFDRIPNDEVFYTVSCDLYNASEKIVDYLWSKGHHKIAVIRGPQSLYTSLERLKGFMGGLNKKGYKTNAHLFATTDLSYEGTEKAMQEILSHNEKPTAIVTFNDYVAFDAIKYIREQTQLVLNKDILIVSYGNLPFTKYIEKNKPFASIEQYPTEQGKQAAKMLLSLINKEELSKKKIVIKGKLIRHFE